MGAFKFIYQGQDFFGQGTTSILDGQTIYSFSDILYINGRSIISHDLSYPITITQASSGLELDEDHIGHPVASELSKALTRHLKNGGTV